jgi:D-alanyl-D-alanine carboxypeptidase
VLRACLAACLAAAALGPSASSAQEPSPEEQRDQVRNQAAQVAADVDALEAEDAQVQAALATLQTNVANQQAALASAQNAQAEADQAVADADVAVADAEAQFTALDQATDQLVVEAFVNPPGSDPLDMFRTNSLTETAVKKALVELQTASDTALLEQLDAARQQLASDRAAKATRAQEAADAKNAADAALTNLQTALAQQQQFAADVEARLDAKLSEAESLRQIDAALSEQIAAQQAALAARLAAAAPPPPSGDVGPTAIAPVPGGLATVACPAGGSITVSATIADDLAALLGAANGAGIHLCGSGYRDPEAQIQLRMEHCGTSYYAIYLMPASQCDPPTARPGTSAHEQGLAVDFTCNGGGAVSWGDVCWDWLESHANSYGFYNLPSEAWHWSRDGT